MATERIKIAPSLSITETEAIDKVFQYDASASVKYVEKKNDFPDFDVNSPDILYFGDSAIFTDLLFDFNEYSGNQYHLNLQWEYWNNSSWAVFTPTDTGDNYTEGFTQDGKVSWVIGSLPSWTSVSLDTANSVSVDNTNRYWVRVKLRPSTVNTKLDIFETTKDKTRYTVSGLAYWTFNINPAEMTPHPGLEQVTQRTMRGSVNIQAATGDGSVRTMKWNNLSESRWEQFIHGISGSEQGKFDRVYFYNDDFTVGSAKEDLQIIEQTEEAYDNRTLTIPFIETNLGIQETEWVSDTTIKDRLLLGMSSKFYGVNIEFKKSSSKYLTDYIGDDKISNIKSITMRFTDSSGDLGGSVSSITYSKDSNASNDGTELFIHNGQIIWNSNDVSDWTAVTLEMMIDNTSELSQTSSYTRDNEELYWCELTIEYQDDYNLESSVHREKTQNIKISEIRSAIDSLYYLSYRRQDGTVPYYYLHIPSTLKNFRPRNYKEQEWIPIKILDVIRTNTEVKQVWDVTMTYVIATDDEAPYPFGLDDSPIDTDSYLYL